MIKYLLFILIGCVSAFGFYPNFHDNPLIDSQAQKKMERYLIPLDHPVKPILDVIFSQLRVTESKENILRAGFDIIAAMPRSFTVIAKHPLAPGYIFKMHLDSEKKGRYGKPSWKWLVSRCKNAAKIRTIIQKKGIVHFMAPEKWLYTPPIYPFSAGKNPQPVIVIETEIDVEICDISREAWKTIVTKKHLDELHSILKKGCGSSHLTSNVPYTKSGKFAFIDTERESDFKEMKRAKNYFSKEMEKYWLKII